MELNEGTLYLFTNGNHCPVCKLVESKLDKLGIGYVEMDCSENENYIDFLMKNQSSTSFPFLVKNGKFHSGNIDEKELRKF